VLNNTTCSKSRCGPAGPLRGGTTLEGFR
jgi:hypothetical protein